MASTSAQAEKARCQRTEKVPSRPEANMVSRQAVVVWRFPQITYSSASKRGPAHYLERSMAGLNAMSLEYTWLMFLLWHTTEGKLRRSFLPDLTT